MGAFPLTFRTEVLAHGGEHIIERYGVRRIRSGGVMRKRRLTVIGTLLLLLYVGAYVGLSRRGYSEARRDGMHGFYYLPPKDSDAWRFGNGTCILLFYPLNALDSFVA
jgi:hypothetical protein